MTLALTVLASLSLGFQQPPPAETGNAPQAQPVQEAQATDATEEDLDRRVCRTEAVVGTRLSGRTCLTQREWNERREAARTLQRRIAGSNTTQPERGRN